MARKRTIKYRLEVNYLSHDYEDCALETSSPIYNKREGMKAYMDALKQKSVDDPEKPVRVWFWEYAWDKDGRCAPITIAKNY